MGRYTGKKCRLISMFILTAMYFLVEIVVGYVTNSMALVADSFHMLSDVAALIVAYLSVKMSPRKWAKNTFGWARAEVLGALVNAVFLVALCFSILVEACKRFIEMEEIHEPELIVIVGGVGLLVNIVGLLLFHEYYKQKRYPVQHRTKTAVTPEVTEQMHERRTGKALLYDEPGTSSSAGNESEHGHSHSGLSRSHTRLSHLVGADDINENDSNFKPPTPPAINEKKKKTGHGHSHHFEDGAQMNMRGVFLHVLADAMGSVIVVISALIVWLTEWPGRYYIDPALSLILIVLILRSVWPLLQESALILLQTVPTHIQVDAIQRRLLDKVDGVLAVHEFHVWQLAGDRIIASAHIRCRNLSEYMKLAEKVKEFFHNEGIHSTTIQPEFLEINELPDDSQVQSNSTTNADCVLDCPKTDQPCVLSTCCGPSKQEEERPQEKQLPRLNKPNPETDKSRKSSKSSDNPSSTSSFNPEQIFCSYMSKCPVPERGKQNGRDSPSPGDTPYLCRQRCPSATSFSRIQTLQSDMESGHLLSGTGNIIKEPTPKPSPKPNNKGSRV